MMVMGYTAHRVYLPPVLTLVALHRHRESPWARLYSDSEMVIWLASGRARSDAPSLKPLYCAFAWPILVVVTLDGACSVWPWGKPAERSSCKRPL